MATLQKVGVPGTGVGGGYGVPKTEEGVSDKFPAGMRVLVVDDDTTCLKILEQMLRKCDYDVTVCSRAMSALSLLQERKCCFDLVISDVHMPDMDGFKLLELVGLEMDLPVIMMSADMRTSMVMKGIKHGACDYLIKPVRYEELKNVWQHVVRKRRNENKDHEQSGSVEDSDRHRRTMEDAEYTSLANDPTDSNRKSHKKKRDTNEEDDGELENDDVATSKKPRVVWSMELHQQFVHAVNQLGMDKAVPKRILEMMNVPGLTRENVASHLQKYRLYLKRVSVDQHQGGIPNSLFGPIETSTKVGSLGRLDSQSLAASGQITPQTLAALHGELLGRSSSGMGFPALDQQVHQQASLPCPKSISVEHEITFGKPLVKCPASIPKHLQQCDVAVEDVSLGVGNWMPSYLPRMGSTYVRGLSNPHSGNMLVTLHQQQNQQPPLPVLSEMNQGINVQPSCLVTPSEPSSFKIENDPISINQNSRLVCSQSLKNFQVGNITPNQNTSYNNPNIIMDHMLFSSSPNNMPIITGQVMDGDLKIATALNGYSISGSIASEMSSCPVFSSRSTAWRLANSALSTSAIDQLSCLMPNACDMESPGSVTTILPPEGHGRNLGFVGKRTSIPTRFAVEDMFQADDLNQNKSATLHGANKVEQLTHLDIKEGSKLGNQNQVLPQFSTNDILSVLSD